MIGFAKTLVLQLPMLWAAIAIADDAGVRDFGAPIALETQASLKHVVSHPERYDAGPVLIKGRVTDVCQRKGCWTVIEDGDAQVRIRFPGW